MAVVGVDGSSRSCLGAGDGGSGGGGFGGSGACGAVVVVVEAVVSVAMVVHGGGGATAALRSQGLPPLTR